MANTKLLEALQGKNRGRPPIWLMRQAGRYLSSYRKLKQGRDLLEMFHNPETIAEVTLLPFEVLSLDAAILFSDILTVFNGLGIRYTFQESSPVVLDQPSSLKIRPPEEAYGHIKSAIEMLNATLKVPLLGFAGAPFTIASYLIEGGTTRDFKKTKQWLFQKPSEFTHIIETITEATLAYLNWQIDAGVKAVQIFDSAANALAFDEFCHYALGPMEKITAALKKRKIPVILFCKGSCLFAESLASLNPDAISLDWSHDLKWARKGIPPSIAVQGNLDPMALFATPQAIGKKVEKILTDTEGDPAYIFNLGHGLLPDTPLENVQYLVDYVHNRSYPTQ